MFPNAFRITALFLCFTLAACGDSRKKEKENLAQIAMRDSVIEYQDSLLKDMQANAAVLKSMLDSVKLENGPVTLTAADSMLTGRWSVKMRCTIAACEGFAVGDTKSEEWLIALEPRGIVITSFDKSQIRRVYRANLQDTRLEAMAIALGAGVRSINLSLNQQSPKVLSGERVLTLEEGCEVHYSVVAERI